MNIINTDVIISKHDVLWDDVSGLVKDKSKKKVLIITNEYEPGSPEDAQLTKMLEAPAACKLTPATYNIIKLKDGEQAAWHHLRELLDPKIVFLIGVLPASLGISALFVLNSPNNFNDCVWLPTLSIKELEQNPALKAQLWNSGMKPIFVEKKFGHL